MKYSNKGNTFSHTENLCIFKVIYIFIIKQKGPVNVVEHKSLITCMYNILKGTYSYL